MRDSNEKKSKPKSLKLSENQLKVIEQAAKEKGMNFSEFMIDSAVHGSSNVNPKVAVKVQEIVNTVLDIYSNLDIAGMKAKKDFEEKTVNLFGELEGLSKAEKIDLLYEDIEALKNGGKRLWEFLNI